jgi:hypothetical protein
VTKCDQPVAEMHASIPIRHGAKFASLTISCLENDGTSLIKADQVEDVLADVDTGYAICALADLVCVGMK